ncbi:MAG: hypothetical protein K6A41_07015 [Bacteroidales bacterium]|nr:hypothetical protein [Bacteroidales bacterium]
MKRNIFFTLAACLVMLLTSCSKDVDLAGTTWQANYSNTSTIEGTEGSVSVDMTLNFKDEINYSMTVNSTVTVMGQTMPGEVVNEDGTYTFDGENGMFDGEQPFTYHKDNKTITTTIELDAEDAEMFGSDHITLTFKQKK